MGLTNPGTVFRKGSVPTTGHVATFAGPNAIQDGGAIGVTIGTTTITSGTDTRVLFDKAGVVGEDSGFTFDYTNKAITLTSISNPAASTLTLTGGTALTTSKPVLNMTQTWNSAGTTFTALLLNVTGTAFNTSAGSNLFNFQISASDAVYARVYSSTLAGNGNVNLFVGAGAGQGGDGFLAGYNVGGTHGIIFGSDQVNAFVASGAGGLGSAPTLFVRGNGAIGWNAAGGFASGASSDVNIWRDAAGILSDRSGSSAQAIRIGGTWTDASNYEFLRLDAEKTTSSTHRIMSEASGTGAVRIIAIDGFTKAGAAAASDIPQGTWALVHDSSGATTKLIYNDAGTLRTVALT